MGKPSFSLVFYGNGIAPCKVIFTSTPQSSEEEIWRFDFKDGHIYQCAPTERTVIHEFTKAGTYPVTAIAWDGKTASDPVSVLIRDGSTPTPVPEEFWLWKWLKDLWKKLFP